MRRSHAAAKYTQPPTGSECLFSVPFGHPGYQDCNFMEPSRGDALVAKTVGGEQTQNEVRIKSLRLKNWWARHFWRITSALISFADAVFTIHLRLQINYSILMLTIFYACWFYLAAFFHQQLLACFVMYFFKRNSMSIKWQPPSDTTGGILTVHISSLTLRDFQSVYLSWTKAWGLQDNQLPPSF